jgi:hypothetical protein
VLQCRGVVEVEAESVAYLISAYHGLDTSSYTFPYVTTWANRADEKPAEVVRATGQRVITATQQLLQHTETTLSDGMADRQPALVDTGTQGRALSGPIPASDVAASNAAAVPAEGSRATTVQTAHPRRPTGGGRSIPPPGRSSTVPATRAGRR